MRFSTSSPPKTIGWTQFQVSGRTAGEPPRLSLSAPAEGESSSSQPGGPEGGGKAVPKRSAVSPGPGRGGCSPQKPETSPQRPATPRDRQGAAGRDPATYPFGCARWRRPRSCHSWSRPRWKSRGSGGQGPPCPHSTPSPPGPPRSWIDDATTTASGLPLPEEAIQPQLAERPRPSQAPTNRWGSLEHSVSSVPFSRSVVSDCLRPHGLQHARPPCPSPTPGVYPNPCPLSQWCHPTISSSVVPFSCPQFSPASGSFPTN